jgi:hypothetical protein
MCNLFKKIWGLKTALTFLLPKGQAFLTTPLVPCLSPAHSIKPFLVVIADITGRGRTRLFYPVFALFLIISSENTDIRGGAAQKGGFVVTFYNVVLTVPAAILGHLNGPSLWLPAPDF